MSREHHPALVQAKRLSDFRGDGEQARELARAFVDFWQTEIAQHFRDEEEILIPVLAQRVGADCAEIAEMLVQHVQLRRHVMELTRLLAQGRTPDGPLINAIGADLRSHVHFEEQILFPFAEDMLTDADLQYLQTALAR